MTTPTVPSERQPALKRARSRRGMSLIELIVAMSISAVIMVAIFSSFLFITRSSLLTVAYSGMDGEARVGLELFGRDVRMALNIANPGGNLLENSVTLLVPTGATTTKLVTYEFDPNTQIFYRNRGRPDERALIHGVESFVLRHFSINENPLTGLPADATNIEETKQVQIQLRSVRRGAGRATATNNVISARYILRNKFVAS